jgi:branched-chain amino acid transport system permease protein
MITLAFGQMLYYFAISWPAYGGEDGISIYVRNGFPGLNTLDPIQFFALAYAVLMAALLFSRALSRSRFGLALAGALFADLNRFVSPAMLSWQTSGEIMVFVILGGVARLFGPVAGAALFILLEHWLGGVSDYWKLFLGLVLLGIVLFARGGLIGTLAGREVAHD